MNRPGGENPERPSSSERAGTLFDSGFNCAQAVFGSLAPSLGLEETTAISIAAGFGGGLACHGDACGAVTGAAMALGLASGMPSEDPENQKTITCEKMNLFLARFIEAFGSITCRDLTGCNLMTEEGMARSEEKNLHETLCTGLVVEAVKIVEDLL